MIKNILSKIFGSANSSSKLPEPTDYEGFKIYPTPIKEAGQWITAGQITLEIEGEVKTHDFIRADKHSSEADAVSFSITKAKQIIDQQKNFLFKDN